MLEVINQNLGAGVINYSAGGYGGSSSYGGNTAVKGWITIKREGKGY
jgi:hypothetical protein